MRSGVLLFLLIASTYRATRLITTDDFPFGEPRGWLENTHPNAWFTALVTCPFCVSVWLSAALVFTVDRWYIHLPLPLLWFGAVAGGVAIVASVVNKLEE